jgi:hypothetical protein
MDAGHSNWTFQIRRPHGRRDFHRSAAAHRSNGIAPSASEWLHRRVFGGSPAGSELVVEPQGLEHFVRRTRDARVQFSDLWNDGGRQGSVGFQAEAVQEAREATIAAQGIRHRISGKLNEIIAMVVVGLVQPAHFPSAPSGGCVPLTRQ